MGFQGQHHEGADHVAGTGRWVVPGNGAGLRCPWTGRDPQPCVSPVSGLQEVMGLWWYPSYARLPREPGPLPEVRHWGLNQRQGQACGKLSETQMPALFSSFYGKSQKTSKWRRPDNLHTSFSLIPPPFIRMSLFFILHLDFESTPCCDLPQIARGFLGCVLFSWGGAVLSHSACKLRELCWQCVSDTGSFLVQTPTPFIEHMPKGALEEIKRHGNLTREIEMASLTAVLLPGSRVECGSAGAPPPPLPSAFCRSLTAVSFRKLRGLWRV